jgi:hypothetical protein
MAKFRQVDEGFTWVFAVSSVDEQVSRLKQWAKTTQCLVPLVRHGVGAEKADWQLPEGMPDTVKVEGDIPLGMGETTINHEWRRISTFFTPGSPIHNVSQTRREAVWVQILEGVHHKEASILTAVKDGKLLEIYPELEKLMEPLGITEYNKPVKAKAKRRAKSKAA